MRGQGEVIGWFGYTTTDELWPCYRVTQAERDDTDYWKRRRRLVEEHNTDRLAFFRKELLELQRKAQLIVDGKGVYTDQFRAIAAELVANLDKTITECEMPPVEKAPF